jgi:bacillithiol system protein YtxJ
MGIFGQLFGGKKTDRDTRNKAMPWIPLTEREQLDRIAHASFIKPQFIYKHSTSCGISSMVLRMMEGTLNNSHSEADFYFLDLHRYPDISKAVAGEFQVRHESPQLLIITNGQVKATASHGAIAEMGFSKYL